MRKQILLLATALTLGSVVVQAGDSGHAGDPAIYRGHIPLKRRIEVARNYKQNLDLYLKPMVLTTLKLYELYSADYDLKIADPGVTGMLRSMINGGVIKYLDNPNYEYNIIADDYCKDKNGQPWAATAVLYDIGGSICVSALRLVEIQANPYEVLGLMLHEHAHHYGYVDVDQTMFDAARPIRSGEMLDSQPERCVGVKWFDYVQYAIRYADVDKLPSSTSIRLTHELTSAVNQEVEVLVQSCDEQWGKGKSNCQTVLNIVAKFPGAQLDSYSYSLNNITPNKDLAIDRVLTITLTPHSNTAWPDYRYYFGANMSYTNGQSVPDFDLKYRDVETINYTFLSKRSSEFCELDTRWNGDSIAVPELF